MTDSLPIYNLLFGRVEGTRTRGMLRKMWLDNVKTIVTYLDFVAGQICQEPMLLENLLIVKLELPTRVDSSAVL